MIKNKYDEVLELFEKYHPGIYEETVDWWPSGRQCITVKLEDGMLFEYDGFMNTIRRIQSSIRDMDTLTLKKEIGHNLQKIVQTRGIPQQEIASRCGITDAMLSRYIHGTSMPGIDKIYALADVLGCRITDILDDKYIEE